jgi:hypothetical protein
MPGGLSGIDNIGVSSGPRTMSALRCESYSLSAWVNSAQEYVARSSSRSTANLTMSDSQRQICPIVHIRNLHHCKPAVRRLMHNFDQAPKQ